MSAVADFLAALRETAFSGDIGDDLASRLVGATDNSIYRIAPDAILFPRSAADMETALQLASQHGVPVTARGGGTGTNGQSLNTGVILDTSRHMTRILSFDADRREVEVEPGVVLDQLNRFLAPHGLFFPPTVSTSSRATLGGMFATDASGKGSRRYGRMSDWVQQAALLGADGTAFDTDTLPGSTEILNDLQAHTAAIAKAFPEMNRSLTGYNLRDAMAETGLNGVKLVAGSEGTLAVTTRLTLRVAPIPARKALSVLAYTDCLTALDHVPDLLAADPVAIEFLDDRIIDLAAKTPMWDALKSVFGGFEGARGFLFVEFAANRPEDILAAQTRLAEILSAAPPGFMGRNDTDAPDQMAALWETRKRSVGLLGAMEGPRVGLPFVEDAAVPPENLTRFVEGFRDILDGHGLDYGMFGHADVGCVHVRPALNMQSPDDRALIRAISDRVAFLARDMGGLIWGEHGKGLRGEYLGTYLPPELQTLMQRIKQRFDPEDRLNPGKLVTAKREVKRLDEAPFRGARDQQIDATRFGAYAKSVSCNGNGACFNQAPDDPMCPSYKVSGDKTLSPKGRATLLREWTLARSRGLDETELGTALLDSMDQCLSCRSCTSQCPIAVDIPGMKSRFLSDWYRTRKRPMRDHLVRHMERLSLLARRAPTLANLAMGNALSRSLLRHVFGLVDVPGFSALRMAPLLKARGVSLAGQGPDPADLFLVLDSFTAPFDAGVIADTLDLLQALGLRVETTRVLPNGKAAQVRGYLEAFDSTRSTAMAALDRIARPGTPFVALEPAVTNLLKKDYGRDDVLSLDQFLLDRIDRIPRGADTGQDHVLFLHCTEKTADPATGSRWQKIFDAAGLSLDLASTGCCGMAGMFGHESEHQDMSFRLFEMSWKDPLQKAGPGALATGFSCRSQSKRFAAQRPDHPAQALSRHLKGLSNA